MRRIFLVILILTLYICGCGNSEMTNRSEQNIGKWNDAFKACSDYTWLSQR